MNPLAANPAMMQKIQSFGYLSMFCKACGTEMKDFNDFCNLCATQAMMDSWNAEATNFSQAGSVNQPSNP